MSDPLDQLRAEAQRLDAEINRLERRQNFKMAALVILIIAAIIGYIL